MSEQRITLVEAVNQALHYSMSHDDNVVVLGEDVGTNGGVFRATVDLKEKFGLKRVMDTPLAETLIAGISIGMASQGLKPVAEIQFMGFIFASYEQMISHAARMRNRTRGRLTCPMVMRAPFGGGIHAPEHHSESTEALLAHIPGLKVVIPSSPRRAYGLLLAAINDPETRLSSWNPNEYTVPSNSRCLMMVKSCLSVVVSLSNRVDDITLVTWGACVKETLEAWLQLKQQGINAEVIDVATIKPLDMDTILASVTRTGRCVIVHEAARSFGVGAEIAAEISSQAFLSLEAPVRRLTGYDITMPYFRMEHHYLLNSQDIVQAAKETLAYQ